MKKSNLKLLFSIIFFILFLLITIFVYFNKTNVIDESIKRFLYSLRSENIIKIMKIVTNLGCTIFIICVAAFYLGMSIYKKRWQNGVSLAGLLILSTILNNVIKVIIKRPRQEFMLVNEPTYSFPSGHAMASTLVYGFLIYRTLKSNIKKKDKILFISILTFIILLVSFTRMFLGAHYFTDVISGIFLNIGVLLLFSFIDDKKHILKN